MKFFTKTVTNAAGAEKLVIAPVKAGLTVIASLFLFISLMSSFYIVSGTEYAVERTPGGDLVGVVEPGVHFKWPFLSTVHEYDMFQTVAYTADEDDGNPMLKRINFADTYGGEIGGTIRFQLPADPTLLVAMHKAYANERNLITSGLKPVSKQLLTYTANQITGENFMQGGQNDYQNRIEDQGNFGLYVTKREKTLVKKNTSSVGLKNENPNKREQRDSYIYINKIQLDKDGNKMRKPLPTTQYGIKVVQVTIDDFKPEAKLKDFIDRKKNQIAIRQKLIEEQENERQSAVTAELKGQRKRVEARQEMLMEKDAAVIQAQKGVELEQKESDMQVVRKNKELEVAQANEGIQKANAVAAKHQANAILYKGKAEATVKKLMYLAVEESILRLEVEKVTQLAKYRALATAKITMPTTVMMGSGEGSGAGNLQELTNLHIMDKIK